MNKNKENGICYVLDKVIQYSQEKVVSMGKESELYNRVYREINEIVGLDATLKLYMHFKGQQITFPIRLYNPHLIQRSVIKEFDGSNIRKLAKKYDYSEKTIRRMIRDCLEDDGEMDDEDDI